MITVNKFSAILGRLNKFSAILGRHAYLSSLKLPQRDYFKVKSIIFFLNEKLIFTGTQTVISKRCSVLAVCTASLLGLGALWTTVGPPSGKWTLAASEGSASRKDLLSTTQQPSHQLEVKQTVCLWKSFLEALLTSFRAVILVLIYFPLLLTYPLTFVSSRWFTLWLHGLYWSVEGSGAAFIKLGQWASTRRDLFSPEFCLLFSGLHHNVSPHAWSETVKTLEQAYGPNWQEIFCLSERQTPVGSGCIAQVYKGYVSAECLGDFAFTSHLKAQKSVHLEAGADIKGLIPVAVKVLHPNVRETMQRDLTLMRVASRCLTFLFPWLHWVNLNQCVEEFVVVMDKQLDMQHELRCLQQFAQDFQSYPSLKVPQPVPGLTRSNILVETFEDGISMSHILRSTEFSSQFRQEVAALGLDVLLQMIFVNNFVHADLHPGNLLVQQSAGEKQREFMMMDDPFDPVTPDLSADEDQPSLTLVLLDCGITARLSPDNRVKFREVFTAIVKGEGEKVADLFLSKSPINNCTNPELFRREMAQLVAKGCQSLLCVSKIRVAELMNDLFAVLSRHKIQLESSFATVVLAIAMLEGLGRTLDPNLNLMDKAKTLLLGSYMERWR